jgi:DNA-binding NtrC family response regulator
LKKPEYTILVVDSGRKLATALERGLEGVATVERAATADTALHIIALQRVDLVVAQLRLSLFSGLDFAHNLKKVQPGMPLIAVSNSPTPEDSAELTALGYVPPIVWPDDEAELIQRCTNTITGMRWILRARLARDELKRTYGFDQILSVDPEVLKVHERLKRVVGSRVPVLVTGESGTGKELVARMIHSTGDRLKRPFITVNCAAVPEGLLESQFFGHEKGAFTGAAQRSQGKFELANNGTLFLDEIGEMTPSLQAKLLRVIEYGEFERVGGAETLKVDVRLITATNRNLQEMVDTGSFRADLFYRINVFPIQLPPLRDRGDDVILLAYHFLQIASQRNNRQIRAISAEAAELLKRYIWPGNIRELENSIERAVLLSDALELRTADFPSLSEWMAKQAEVVEVDQVEVEFEPDSGDIRLLADVEREAIRRALELTQGNMALAARKLGIARGTLYNKIVEYEIKMKEDG